MKYQAIIFDFFDVIRTDPYKAWLKRHNITRTGEYAEVSKLLDRGDIDAEDFFSRLSSLSGHSVQSVKDEYENTKLVDEKILHLIKDLKKLYKIGLLSNAPSKYIRGLLKEHDYEQLFDSVVVSSEVQLIKPAAEVFHHILGELGVKAEQAVFIDDNENNVDAARQCGIATVHFTGMPILEKELAELGVITS